VVKALSHLELVEASEIGKIDACKVCIKSVKNENLKKIFN
jgi:hypothetical protein